MDLFSAFLFGYVLAFASHTAQKAYCVRLTVSETKFHMGVLVKKTFLSHICHDLRLANNTSETPCSGSFTHGFPTQFSWSLYASLTDSVIVWILAVG